MSASVFSMDEDDLILRLRLLGEEVRMGRLSVVGLLEDLERIKKDRLLHFEMITLFRRAFPEIPLRVLIDAGTWSRFGGGGMTDKELEGLFGPWFGLD